MKKSLVTLGLFALVGCRSTASHSAVVERLPSPNGQLEAVLLETNGGAKAALGYEVRLGERGGDSIPVAHLYGAVRKEKAYGADLHWINDRSLQVTFLRAASAQLNRSRLDIDHQVVRVYLTPGVENESAPAGSMESHTRPGR